MNFEMDSQNVASMCNNANEYIVLITYYKYYPHVRGENRIEQLESTNNRETPPRTWGKRDDRVYQ